ncbi:DUF6333 family protein [Streptomyces boluensis]|uniref:Uncharacterized protein n=1 Tax=Streptomyces boluensis TaxID=1775135 RepID=A0A964UQX8_9ACTN|nr:DUF6333 family protein [Streptomyces boluensis]NBE52408.1 hypothetical protein [Streptomyces boluensis]
MTDTDHWTSAPDRIAQGSLGLCHLSVFQAPFNIDARDLPPQDTERARAFVESFASVEEVLEELGPRSVQTALSSSVRSDLDIVHATAWGGMLAIADPAFADDGTGMPLLSSAERLRERFPDARIVGRVTCYGADHGGAEHTEDVVWLPDGAMFHACGRPGEEPFAVTGDPHAVVASLNLPGWALHNADIDLRAKPNEIEWFRVAGLALGRSDPWGWEELRATAFRVRHSASAVRSMEDLYFS